MQNLAPTVARSDSNESLMESQTTLTTSRAKRGRHHDSASSTEDLHSKRSNQRSSSIGQEDSNVLGQKPQPSNEGASSNRLEEENLPVLHFPSVEMEDGDDPSVLTGDSGVKTTSSDVAPMMRERVNSADSLQSSRVLPAILIKTAPFRILPAEPITCTIAAP